MVKILLNIFESDPDFGGINQLIESTSDWDVKNSTWTGCHNPEREFSVILQCQGKLLHFPNENIYVHVFTYIGFPGCSAVKNLFVSAGDTGDVGSIPGLGRSPRGGNGIPLQDSYLKIPWTEEPGRLQFPGSQSWTQLCNWAHTYMYKYILLTECVDYRYWRSPID